MQQGCYLFLSVFVVEVVGRVGLVVSELGVFRSTSVLKCVKGELRTEVGGVGETVIWAGLRVSGMRVSEDGVVYFGNVAGISGMICSVIVVEGCELVE